MLKRWEDGDIYARIMDRSKGREKFICPPRRSALCQRPHSPGHRPEQDIERHYREVSLHDGGTTRSTAPAGTAAGCPSSTRWRSRWAGGCREDDQGGDPQALQGVNANKFLDIQREEFKRLGGFGVWQDPYITMDYGYEATIVRSWASSSATGPSTRRASPSIGAPPAGPPWPRPRWSTTTRPTPAIFVGSMISDISEKVPELKDVRDDVYMVIWTTTPWTIPANLAIALHPDAEYSAVKTEEYSVLVLATDLVEDVMKQVGVSGFTTLAVFKGSLLEGLKAKHPLYDRESILILAPFVTLGRLRARAHRAGPRRGGTTRSARPTGSRCMRPWTTRGSSPRRSRSSRASSCSTPTRA